MTDELEYEVQIEPDEGFRLEGTSASPWAGWRIRYRRPGERRWRKFLLETDDDTLPAGRCLQAIVAHHEDYARSSGQRRQARRRAKSAVL